ncbi:MAG: right-handed parallel beta-helix repeat-containing protein [Anaerolineae bacterium]|nr:right-handed parallel beta-helix repeat-containing protein [Anaerolineae bacterium]
MKNKLFMPLLFLSFILGLLFMVTAAAADSMILVFEAYTNGSVNGQDGWSSLGSAGSGCAVYDHAVTANTYGYSSFGTKSLRLSNAVTSGCFSDHTFTKSLVNEAGETTASNDGLSGGTRQPYFEAQWDFASTVPNAEQPGLSVVASPDRGDGARMSWIQMADTPGGLEINFYDYQESATPEVCGNDFILNQVATGLDRTVPHTIKLQMYLVDGPANDVVKVFVDGALMHTGTSWEDYFRNCESNPTHTVDSILFRTGGAAAPATAGNGFLIDNLNLVSGQVTQCTTDCYVDAANGNDAFGGTSFADAKKTIQTAINQVSGGGTVHMAAGTYAPTATIGVNKAVSLIGAGETTLINAGGMPASSYGILVTAGNVSLQNFTLQNARSYGIKIQGNISDVTIQDVTVQNSARSNIDFNGVDNITVTDVVLTGAVSGVGLAITDGLGANLSNITTSGNAWAGMAIYTSTYYPPAGSSNITLSGTNSFGELVPFYTEPANPSDPITNINVSNDFHWTVRRTATPTTIAYFQTLTAAKNAVEALPATISTSAIYDLDNDRFFVPCKASAPAYTIQAAIEVASAGDTVLVEAGTYNENINVNKRVAIMGAGSGNDPAANTILRKSSNSAVVTLAASGMSSTAPVLFKNLRVEPVNVYGFNVGSGNIQYVELDNVQVVGTNETNDSEAEVGLKVATDASLSYLRVVASAFDHLTYGWYFAKHGDWGPGGSNVTNVYAANTSFSHNDVKGIYVEKLSNATFDGCTVHNNGLNTGFFNAQWNAGFDINLKGQETYQNLIFNNMVVTNNGLGVANGAGFLIKARDDGATYGAHPATLDNVQINNSIFSGNTRAIRFGEPDKNNAGPTHVVLASSAITANTYGLINTAQATVTATLNWWGSQTGPTHSSNPGGMGNSVSENITFTPWLCDGTDTSPNIGFQPDLILSSGGRCTGSIAIFKQSEPAGATGFTFSGDLGSFNLNDDGSKMVSNLTPGNYTITEVVSPGWDLTNVSCTGGSHSALPTGITIQLVPGNDVSCTFFNQQHAELQQYDSYLPLIFK